MPNQVYDTKQGELKYTLGQPDPNAMAATAVRFRPSGADFATKNVLLVGGRFQALWLEICW